MKKWAGVLCFLIGAALPARAAGVAYSYHVVVAPRAETLAVTAALAPNSDPELSVASGAEPYVQGPAVRIGRRWVPLERRGTSWYLPKRTPKGPWQVRYVFRLGAAADMAKDDDVANRHASAILSPPAAWLLYPQHMHDGDRYRFTVQLPSGVEFLTGVWPASAPHAYEADAITVFHSPEAVFGRLNLARWQVDGDQVVMGYVPGGLTMPDARLVRWIRRETFNLARFYGRFPVRRVAIIVLPAKGSEFDGQTLGNGGVSIRLLPPAKEDADCLQRAWQVVHELVHLTIPGVPGQYHWLEEGIASYIEPFIRVQAGELTPQKVWGDLVAGLPQGEPKPGDRGLDHTHTWGRTYWGGSLFCLVADLEIRELSHGRYSLPDALRAIVAAGGNVATPWSLARVLRTGDRAVGVNVLEKLHARMGPKAYHVDLAALWKRLGIRDKNGKVTFHSAPLAAIRNRMTRRWPTASESDQAAASSTTSRAGVRGSSIQVK